MAVLTDRLDFVLGKKAAGQLEEHFGIRTVNDLLRHYPRKYSDGMTVLGEGDRARRGRARHVRRRHHRRQTLKWTNQPPKREYMVVTLGHRTAEGDRDLLQREVPQEVLEQGHAGDAVRGSRLLQGHLAADPSGVPRARFAERQDDRNEVAQDDRRRRRDPAGEELLSAFERDFFPIYPASKKVQSWDIYACVRQVLDVLDPIEEPLPESFLRQHNLMAEDEALRAIHTAEKAAERDAARRRG